MRYCKGRVRSSYRQTYQRCSKSTYQSYSLSKRMHVALDECCWFGTYGIETISIDSCDLYLREKDGIVAYEKWAFSFCASHRIHQKTKTQNYHRDISVIYHSIYLLDVHHSNINENSAQKKKSTDRNWRLPLSISFWSEYASAFERFFWRIFEVCIHV